MYILLLYNVYTINVIEVNVSKCIVKGKRLYDVYNSQIQAE